MVKLILFDLDGVITDTKEIHYRTLNNAISEIDPKYIITEHEHVTRYDGLKTITKLNMLTEDKGLPITSLNKHLVLTGNPGTGKTTVARILGEIYKEIGLLSKGHFVEVGQENLVAEYTGQTAKKTAKVIAWI
jgi:phosphoglycolate phosphatase-like HAD superfamily hydrolase